MTVENRPGTSGGARGTGGMGAAAIRRLSLLVMLVIAALQAVANALSGMDDRAGTGVRIWEIWAWELTSVIAWIAVWPLIWRAVMQVRPPRFGWPATILIHFALSIPLSMLHILGMLALRAIVYAAQGLAYDPGAPGFVALYEYRKDLVTYVIVAVVFALVQWRASLAADAMAPTVDPPVIEVRDGAVTHRIPAHEIDHVESAGNYVVLGWRGRTILHRATLATVEAALSAHGFVRIHRTRLVRRAVVRSIVVNQSGDFEVVLESGAQLKGSRRFRGNL